ncbi:MAG: hypothetical protein ABH827_02510 [bacterium]
MIRTKKIAEHLTVFWQLLKVDLLMLKKNIHNKNINSFIWASSTIIISSYALPLFGTDLAYGSFIAAGVVIGCGGFIMYSETSNFISDLEGDQHINYQLTLPLPSNLLFLKIICVYTINAIILCCAALVTAKIVLYSRLNLSGINFLHLTLSIIVSSLFLGAFTLWAASCTKDMLSLENVFMRILYPLWVYGCFQFSWAGMVKICAPVGYLCLLNPFTYTTESIRAAMLGQTGSINFWYSITALLTFSFGLGWWAIKRFKKRLDFV